MDSKLFYELLRFDVSFGWTKEHEQLFQIIKGRIVHETILVVPNLKYPFHIHVDSSSIGTVSIPVQDFPIAKHLVSFNSRVFTKHEQKISTLHRELCGIISALQTYERLIIGSPHPIKIFCDHKSLLYPWARKERFSNQFLRCQVIITQFTKLQISWTPGKNLAFPNLLSRKISLKDLNGHHQLADKEVSKNITSTNEADMKFNTSLTTTALLMLEMTVFIPLFAHVFETETLHLKDDGTEMISTIFDSKSPKVLPDVSDSFREGKNINFRRKTQAPPMVVEAEVHEKFYSEIEFDTEISDN